MKFALFLTGILLAAQAAAGTLSFGETHREIRAEPDARKVTADFEFDNRGEEAVRIVKYDASCACMSVGVKGGKLNYAPGEEGVIRAVFDMGNFSGSTDKVVNVWLEGDPENEPSVRLTVEVHIPELVTLEPRSVRWEAGDAPDAKSISIVMDHDEPIRVTEVECANEQFEIELKTVEEGEKYEIVVTPKSTESQQLGVIHITTDCEIEKQANPRAFCIVRRSPVVPAK